jgi:hypothetical protein
MFDRVRWCEVLIMRVSELACKCAAKLNSEERVKGKGWEVNGYGDRTQPNPESRIPNPESRIPTCPKYCTIDTCPFFLVIWINADT